LEEEIHSRSTHNDEAGYHAGVDDHLDPFLAVRNSNQSEANAAFDGDESEAPRLLEDVKPLESCQYVFLNDSDDHREE
jgi:hypothetical protein